MFKLSKIKAHIISLIINSKKLSNFYYFFYSKSFSREHQAVLAGRFKYSDDVKTDNSSFYQLIRNTHRIEKGLLMRPRRPIFAIDYIEETIDSFEKSLKFQKSEKKYQLKWSRDVLKLYFQATKGSDLIEKQKMRFNTIINELTFETNQKDSVPYHKSKLSNISYDEFFLLTRQRRSTRWFKNEIVPRSLIDKAILAALQSPSACNRQPFEYKIIDDENLLEKIVNIPGGTAGYAHNIPLMIIAVGNLNAYFSERDRHLIYIDASLANMTLMLALETLGLSSCAINWPDIEEKEIQIEELLNLEKYQRPVMCIAVGYNNPEGLVAFSEKKSLETIRQYN